MKTFKFTFIVLFALSSLMTMAQNDYPAQDEDYKSSWEEDYRGDDYITYSYYLENIGGDPIVFYNFNITPNDDRYDILESYPDDVLILEPYKKKSYLQVKVYTNGPALTWNSKFMRVKDESSSYPQQNRDYVYYWKLRSSSDDDMVYSYHLKNISDKTIKFYDFTLNDNGGEYYEIDNLLEKPVFTNPGENFQLVKYRFYSGDTPSVNWYADWTSFKESDDPFCSGVLKIMEASKDGFSSIMGDVKVAANDTDIFFDEYYCNEHIDGTYNETIEDLLFFYQYRCTIGFPGTLDEMNSRFYEFKSKIEACLPELPEKVADDEDSPEYLTVEYEGEVDYNMHFIRLSVEDDYDSDDYYLVLEIEESY